MGKQVILYPVVEADVNEVPVLQPCRLQDGAEMAVELVTSNQVIFSCPASATVTTDPAQPRKWVSVYVERPPIGSCCKLHVVMAAF